MQTDRLCWRFLAPSLAALFATSALANRDTVEQLEARVIELREQLSAAEASLLEARKQTVSVEHPEETAIAAAQPSQEPDSAFKLGPVAIGGAMRVNYVYGDYESDDSGPNRGDNGGNVELDTFRINLDLDYKNVIGKMEYRWYSAGSGTSYNFMHTGWLGYRFEDASQVEVGLNRVPFGAGPYGISQSWFFDQHYYVGLSDDPDLGIKYSGSVDDWSFDLGYYARSEPNFNGRSADSSRYGYDAVRWDESVDQAGNVLFGTARNGYREKDQFNLRGIYHLTSTNSSSEIGFSLQYGQLDGLSVDDGDHWAASGHIVHRRGNFTAAGQFTRYEFDIDQDNPWGTDELIPMGAYDFAWTVASRAWLPAFSLSYKIPTERLPWLDYALPYIEWSSIIKDENDYNDSQLFVAGTAWASGGWYIYSDLAYSNGNYFVGNKQDDYSRIDSVGDFGVAGNDKWNYRFNLNLGYYY